MRGWGSEVFCCFCRCSRPSVTPGKSNMQLGAKAPLLLHAKYKDRGRYFRYLNIWILTALFRPSLNLREYLGVRVTTFLKPRPSNPWMGHTGHCANLKRSVCAKQIHFQHEKKFFLQVILVLCNNSKNSGVNK